MSCKVNHNPDHLYPVAEALSINYQEYLYKLLPGTKTPLGLIHHQKLREEARRQLLCEVTDVFYRFLEKGTNSKGESLTGCGAPMIPPHRLYNFVLNNSDNLRDPVFTAVDFVLPEPGVRRPKADV